MFYAITDRRLYGPNAAESRQRLLDQATVWAENRVAFVQLREKDLSGRELAELAKAMRRKIRSEVSADARPVTRLLINGRLDVALAAEADGVHLPSGPDALTPEEVRDIFAVAGRVQFPIISISCHTLAEVEAARRAKVDCILFAPVFEKTITEQHGGYQTLAGTGVHLLQQACVAADQIPVYALGGVTTENAQECLRAGAAGIAGIRMMMEPSNAWASLI